jgi:hypothetical protein
MSKVICVFDLHSKRTRNAIWRATYVVIIENDNTKRDQESGMIPTNSQELLHMVSLEIRL